MNHVSLVWRESAAAALERPAPHHPPAPQHAAAERRIAVFVDRSPASANALRRAALVARDVRLPLHVIAVQPLHADLAAAAAWARTVADGVRGMLDLPVRSQAVAGTLDHDGLAAADGASLIVLPHAGRGWPPGSWVLRLLRRSRRPVLVARLPAQASYRRVLAAVELDLDACSLIAAAHALSRGAAPQVLHVLDTAHEEVMRLADVPAHAVREQRRRDALRARRELDDLIAAAGARGAQALIAHGGAAHQLVERQLATGSDLLVTGKRPRAALVDAVRGGVVQRALRGVEADVLVLPVEPRAPGEAWRILDLVGGPR